MKIKLLPIFLIIAISSCKYHRPEAMICGQIDGYYQKPIHVFSTESIYDGKALGHSKASSFTNDDGKFCIKVMERDTGFYHLVTDEGTILVETPIILAKRDSVYVKTSVYNILQPVFSGNNALFNSFFVDFRHSLTLIFRNSRINKFHEDKFVTFVDSISDRYRKSIDSLIFYDDIYPKGHALLYAELYLFLASKRYEYLRYHNYDTQAVWEYYKPNKKFYTFANGLIDSASPFWFNPHYSKVVDATIEDEFHREQLPKLDFFEKIRIIDEKFIGIAKEIALCQLAKNFPKHLADEKFFGYLVKADSMMKEISTKPALMQFFADQYSKVNQLKPGNTASNLTLPDKDGKPISISSLKGKVVLLVFWGTWCPPCLSSIPKYIELQKKFQGTEAAFVFVSLEARKSDVDGWKDFIQGKGDIAADLLNGMEFPGIQLVAKGQFQNPEIQPYVITYAPSYVLIDSNGRIAYPRVDLNDELFKKIEELLSNP